MLTQQKQSHPAWSLSPQETAVLAALRTTGQADGNLYDIHAVARAAHVTPSVARTILTSLYRKGYIPPAGVSEDKASEARQQLNELVGRLHEARTRGEFTWGDEKLTYRVRRGRAPSVKVVRRIGERLGLAPDQIEPYVCAAALLQRYVHSRGRRNRRPSSPVLVVCSLCNRVIQDAAPGCAEKNPVCSECAPRRSAAVRRRGNPDHPGGRRLFAILCTLYAGLGTPNGILAAAARALGVDEERLAKWIWTPPKFPRQTILRKLADGMTSRRPDRPVTPAEIMRWYGWERTWEEEYRARLAARPRPQCPMCGRRRKSYVKTCSFACRTLQQVHAQGFRTDGGKYLFTIMALACELTADRIASLVARPLEAIAGWVQRPQVRELADAIRVKRKRDDASRAKRTHRGGTLLRTTARVLDLSVPTLNRYLHHVYRRSDKKRRVTLRFPKRMDLAGRIGLGADEFRILFQFTKSFTDFSSERGPGDRRTFGRDRGEGRPLKDCGFIRAVLSYRWNEKLSLQMIADRLNRDELPRVSKTMHTPDGLAVEPKTLRFYWIRHGRHCGGCRPLVAMDLARVEGRTPSEIARLLRCSRMTVHRDLVQMERKYPVAYRLRTSEVASRFKVSRSTIVRLESNGPLKALRRSPGGKRIFNPSALPPSLPTVR